MKNVVQVTSENIEIMQTNELQYSMHGGPSHFGMSQTSVFIAFRFARLRKTQKYVRIRAFHDLWDFPSTQYNE